MCELWIRTQNKTRLLKVSEIELLNEYYITTNYYATVLGGYSARERAMEVLDEIQKILMGDILTFKNIGTPEEVSKVLEKVKRFCTSNPDWNCLIDTCILEDFIDNQITELRGGEND